jgi:hypothetical protein
MTNQIQSLAGQAIRQAKQTRQGLKYQVIDHTGHAIAITNTFASAMAYLSNRCQGQQVFGQGFTIKPLIN